MIRDLDRCVFRWYPGNVFSRRLVGAKGDSEIIKRELSIGDQYTLADIAELLDVSLVSLQRRGVFHKSGSDAFIILVNLEKQEDATPYADKFNEASSVLFWEGQLKNRDAEKFFAQGMPCHVFIHKVIKTPYVYYGTAVLVRSQIFAPGTPSRFVLYLADYAAENDKLFKEDILEVPIAARETEEKRFQKIRNGQDEYRKNVIRLWHGKCAVTGVDETSWLIASHIKPWRESNNIERLDPKNSLLLTPDYDKLFDLGVISFSPDNGRILLPENASFRFWQNLNKLGIDDQKTLSDIPDGTERYLDYHQHMIFGFKPSDSLDAETIIDNMLFEKKISLYH